MDAHKIQIRRAVLADRPIICGRHCAIHLATSVRNEFELMGQINDLKDDFPALFSDEIFGATTTNYWVAETISNDNNFQIIGSIGHLEQTDDSGQTYSYLSSFSVGFEYRNKGIGKELLKTALLNINEKRIKKVELLTLREVMDPAIKMYLACGFTVERERQGHNYKLVDMVLDEIGLTDFVRKHQVNET